MSDFRTKHNWILNYKALCSTLVLNVTSIWSYHHGSNICLMSGNFHCCLFEIVAHCCHLSVRPFRNVPQVIIFFCLFFTQEQIQFGVKAFTFKAHYIPVLQLVWLPHGASHITTCDLMWSAVICVMQQDFKQAQKVEGQWRTTAWPPISRSAWQGSLDLTLHHFTSLYFCFPL